MKKSIPRLRITIDFLTNLEKPTYFPPITIARTFSGADTLL